MANHVSYSVRFEEINEAAKAKWNELTSRLVKEDYEYWFGDLWVYENGPVSADDVRQYEWTTSNIGPKWCYIQDFDEDGFSGYSAWSAPEQGLEWILGQLKEADPNIITSFYYDDEMPNFYGAYVYEGDECYDGFEDEGDELITRCIEENPDELGGKWDEDDMEWADEDAEDFYREVMYETMHNAQADLVSDTLNQIREDRSETENNQTGC